MDEYDELRHARPGLDTLSFHRELAEAQVPVVSVYRDDGAEEGPDTFVVVVPRADNTAAMRGRIEAALRSHNPNKARDDEARARDERATAEVTMRALATGTGPLTPDQMADALRLLARATLRGAP